MLKQIRNGAIGNPWFFRILMLAVAAVFAISMGWWGFAGDEREETSIAMVGSEAVSIDEYKRTYRAERAFYQQLFQDDFDDDDLRKRVMEGLVEQKLWIQEAQKMGLSISDAALRDSITSLSGFQKDGAFSPKIYKNYLSRQRYSPKRFEAKQRAVLLANKARSIVKEGVALTPTEIEEAERSDPANPDPARFVEDRLLQKQNRAAKAYVLALKGGTTIFIKEELL